MAAASGKKPKGDGRQVRRTRYTCPTCGNVALFSTGEVMQCPACGHYASDDEPLVPVEAGLATPAPAAPSALSAAPGSPTQRPEPPLGLAIGALACGLVAAMSLWVFPLSLLLAIAAIALGATALSRHEDDAGVQVMSIIGIVIGGLVLLFAFVLWPFFIYDDGGSSYTYYEGGSSNNVEVENNGGGSGGGGGSSGDGGSSGGGSEPSGGGSGGAGDGGGSSGGGGGGAGGGSPSVGVDTGTDAPAPAGLLVAGLLVSLAAWRRRA
jgi:hypothetical protein